MIQRNVDNSKKLYELFQEFYNYYSFFDNARENEIYDGCLIESNLIENIKNQINYNDYIEYFKNNISFEDFKVKIKDAKTPKIWNFFPYSLLKIDSSKKFVETLNENKIYCLLTLNLFSIIFNKPCPSYLIYKFSFFNNKISLSLNSEENLYFLNKKNGIIEKMLLRDKFEKEDLSKDKRFNTANKINKFVSNFNALEKENLGNKFNKYNLNTDIILDEKRKNDIEFLLRVYFHFNNIKNTSNKFGPNSNCYFINSNLLEKYKEFYEFNNLENQLNSLRFQSIINKYKTQKTQHISSQNVNILLKKIIPLISNEYKNRIKNKDNKNFIEETNKIDLYTLKFHKYNNPDVFNIIDTVILRKEAVNVLMLGKSKEIINKLNLSKFIYQIIKQKSICKYNNTINIGRLNEKNIFESEIIIRVNDEETGNSLINDLNNDSFENFVNNINITKENVGKYKDSNNQLIILKELKPLKKPPNLEDNQKQLIHKNNNNFEILHKVTFQEKNNFNNIINTPLKKNNNKNLKRAFPIKSNEKNNITKTKNIVNDNIKINPNPYMTNKNDLNIIKNHKPKEIQIKVKNEIKKPNNIRPLSSDNRAKKLESIKNIKNLIYIMCDMNKIKKRMSNSLNNLNYSEKYYPINSKWLEQYIKTNNLLGIYQNQNIKSVINDNNIDIPIKNIFDNVANNINYNDIAQNQAVISFDKITLNINPKENKINNFIYYNDFVLLSQETINILNYDYNFHKYEQISYYFRDKKIYVIFNKDKNIQIYSLIEENNYYNIIPEIFFDFNKNKDIKEQISLLQKIGYNSYIERFSLFKKEENFSPLFINDDDFIGNVFFYNKNIKNYGNDIYNPHLMALIKLFFSCSKSKKMLNFFKKRKYYLINKNLIQKIKEFFNYYELEESLQQNNEINNTIENYDYITNKKIYLIIKNLSDELKNKFRQKKNININIDNDFTLKEIEIKVINNTNLMYYDDFCLLTDEIYNILIKNLSENSIYVEFYSTDNYIYFKIPDNLNNIENKFIIELCPLNEYNINNNFNPDYIIEFDTKEIFEKFVSKNDLDTYLNNVKENFKENNCSKIYNEKNSEIGLIYKLKQKSDDIININNNNICNDDNINNNTKLILSNKINIENNITLVACPSPCIPFSPQNKSASIKKEFNFPPLTYLESNSDFPQYYNPILLCFCQIEDFINYLKYKPRVDLVINKYQNEEKGNLIIKFKALVNNIWKSSNNGNFFMCGNNNISGFDSYDVIKTIYHMNNMQILKSPCELIHFILSLLHNELNKAKQNIIFPQQINYSNEESAFTDFKERFQALNISIISDLFFSIVKTTIRCYNCKALLQYNFDNFNYLYFDLWEIKNTKIENCQSFDLIDSFSLEDCFNFYQKINFQNKNNCCPMCKFNTIYLEQKTVYTTSKILIIILNIEKEFLGKIKFIVWEIINLKNYVEKNSNSVIYNLRGIVAFCLNTSINSNAYAAYCKNPINNLWYKYENDSVIQLNNTINEVNESYFPCVLFYQNDDKYY